MNQTQSLHTSKSMLLEVHTITKSKKPGVQEMEPGIFVVRVVAVPEKGKANEEVIERLAEYLKVSKSSVQIVRGGTHSVKMVQVDT